MEKEEIAKYIKDAIIRGKLEPGQRVVEAKLCRALNVGRGKVRESLRQLEQEGFIDIIPHSGAVIKEVSQKDISQIYDIMSVLEGLSIRIATPVISDDDIGQIEDLVTKMEENRDNKFILSHYNSEFHRVLTELGGNTRLIAFMENIRAQTHRMRLQTFYNEDQVKASLREHRAILQAIKERKPQRVENLIRKHYLDAKDRLIKYTYRTL